jgi:hypothetical protein
VATKYPPRRRPSVVSMDDALQHEYYTCTEFAMSKKLTITVDDDVYEGLHQ